MVKTRHGRRMEVRTSMRVVLQSKGRMSNRQYHIHGKPTWWARIGSGPDAVFLPIGRVRGDSYLNIEIDVPDDTTEIHIGVGPRGRHGVRETIRIGGAE